MDANYDMKFYRERWKAVEEIERQELRASTVQTNWRQLNSILRRSLRLGITRGDDDGEMEIFKRWTILRVTMNQPEGIEPVFEPMEDIRILADKYPNLDISRIEKWVKQFADVLGMPSLWDDIAGILK